MSQQVTEELKQKIMKYLGTVSKAKNRDIARAVGEEKHLVDKAVGELARADQIEYQTFGGVSYVVIKGK